MAWASVGTLGASATSTVNQASAVHSTTAQLDAGNVGVVAVAVDNATTTDGATSDITAVVDLAPQFDPAKVGTNTLSNDNKTVTQAGANNFNAFGKTGRDGKFVFTMLRTFGGTAANNGVGVGNASALTGASQSIGGDTNSIGYYADGTVYANTNTVVATIASWATGTTITVAVDTDAQLIWFKPGAGNWNNSGSADPATGAGGISLVNGGGSGTVFPGAYLGDGAAVTAAVQLDVNPGGLPSGFAAWDTYSGETWTKAGEFTNGQGTVQTGATCAIWYKLKAATLDTGGLIKASFANSGTSDKSCMSAWEFTVAAGSTVSVSATGTLAADATTTVGSVNPATASAEFLRFRATATEHSSAVAWTKTAAFDSLLSQAVSTGTTAAAMAVRGEFDISTGTGSASAPTWAGTNSDHASIYIAFLETLAAAGTPVKMHQYRQRRI